MSIFICLKNIFCNNVLFQLFQELFVRQSYIPIYVTTACVSMLHDFWDIIMVPHFANSFQKKVWSLVWSFPNHSLFDELVFHFSDIIFGTKPCLIFFKPSLKNKLVHHFLNGSLWEKVMCQFFNYSLRTKNIIHFFKQDYCYKFIL